MCPWLIFMRNSDFVQMELEFESNSFIYYESRIFQFTRELFQNAKIRFDKIKQNLSILCKLRSANVIGVQKRIDRRTIHFTLIHNSLRIHGRTIIWIELTKNSKYIPRWNGNNSIMYWRYPMSINIQRKN